MIFVETAVVSSLRSGNTDDEEPVCQPGNTDDGKPVRHSGNTDDEKPVRQLGNTDDGKPVRQSGNTDDEEPVRQSGNTDNDKTRPTFCTNSSDFCKGARKINLAVLFPQTNGKKMQ